MSVLGSASLSAVGRVSSAAPLRQAKHQQGRASPPSSSSSSSAAAAPRTRSRRRVVTAASAEGSVVVAGATTSTGRLVAGLCAKAFGGDNVTLIVNKDAQADYWPTGMPDDIAEKRMYAPASELLKAKLVDPRDAAPALASAKHVILCAEWGATQSDLVEALLSNVGSGLKRVVLLSRVGINRRDKNPFVDQNKPPKKIQEMALGLKLSIGEATGPGCLDGFADAEEALLAAAAGKSWSAHVVRSGELRGNGPLLLADLSARLVDNMYDVKYQDLYFKKGDDGQGYTKRLNIASVLVRMATMAAAPPTDVAALSVVCEMADPFGLMGEKVLTEPTGVERRKGYDMSKGRAPPAIEDKLIDELVAAL
eukprot:CAMPEP_0197583848 /NCGR_PEP_ID=MMETSP1326-20131121/6632_1 /TAXON_ID=1155430 /ORGANISM="Genus nov. species nov., Strain RCC2288" /LENGTH=365 /DNA_ID=CAMNT_0043148125 /DNA_START=46 /DNA_END=1143 /DNA_ORIENTATION=+